MEKIWYLISKTFIKSRLHYPDSNVYAEWTVTESRLSPNAQTQPGEVAVAVEDFQHAPMMQRTETVRNVRH